MDEFENRFLVDLPEVEVDHRGEDSGLMFEHARDRSNEIVAPLANYVESLRMAEEDKAQDAPVEDAKGKTGKVKEAATSVERLMELCRLTRDKVSLELAGEYQQAAEAARYNMKRARYIMREYNDSAQFQLGRILVEGGGSLIDALELPEEHDWGTPLDAFGAYLCPEDRVWLLSEPTEVVGTITKLYVHVHGTSQEPTLHRAVAPFVGLHDSDFEAAGLYSASTDEAIPFTPIDNAAPYTWYAVVNGWYVCATNNLAYVEESGDNGFRAMAQVLDQAVAKAYPDAPMGTGPVTKLVNTLHVEWFKRWREGSVQRAYGLDRQSNIEPNKEQNKEQNED